MIQNKMTSNSNDTAWRLFTRIGIMPTSASAVNTPEYCLLSLLKSLNQNRKVYASKRSNPLQYYDSPMQ